MSAIFPRLLADKTEGGLKSKKSVAIITPDVMGPLVCGGVGTSFLTLAETLVANGHSVTLVFCNFETITPQPFAFWQEQYSKKGIRLIRLPKPRFQIIASRPLQIPYAVYLYLRENRDFDIVHFPEMSGTGYYSLMSKKLGFDFQNILFCVDLLGPHLWHRSENREYVMYKEDLLYDFLERRSVELADVVVSPSQYMLNWVRSRGWSLPRRTFVEQLILTPDALSVHRGNRSKIREIVFFGRLETRKGIELFCDAIESLPPRTLRKVQITFLGNFGLTEGEFSWSYLKQRSARWKFRWRSISNYDQGSALRYLKSRNVLAVVPSRAESFGLTAAECVGSGIPIIALRNSAFEEMISKKDHSLLFFQNDPKNLAAKIEKIIDQGYRGQARFAVSPNKTARNWQQWHRSLKLSAPLSVKAKRVRISVCVTHRNRPHSLLQCLQALREQSAAPYEIIVCDDASDTPESKRLLARFERHPPSKSFKLIKNRKPQGLSSIRNAAAKAARGDFLLFIDSDEIIKKKGIENFIRAATGSNADIFSCAFDHFSGENYPKSRREGYNRHVPIGDSLALGLYINPVGGMNSLISRKAYLALGGLRSEADTTGEDSELFVRALLSGYRLLAIPESLFWRRTHKGNRIERSTRYRYQEDMFRTRSYRNLTQHPDIHPLIEVILGMNARPVKGFEIMNGLPWFNEKRPRLYDQKMFFDKKLYSARSAKDFSKWSFDPGLECFFRRDYLELLIRDPSARLTLPRFRMPKTREILVEIELTAFKQGSLEIEYGDNVASHHVVPGIRKLQIVLDIPPGRDRLRIRPSKIPETYFIRRLEVLASCGTH